ncbi:MAG TPA: YncE family protein [Gemmatimonadales bacterium]
MRDLPLPGPAERFDYQSLDTAASRLWIAHMGAGEVLAVDLHPLAVALRAGGLPRVTGVLAVPSLGRVFASAAGSHAVAELDAMDGRILTRFPAGRFPDGLAYAPGVHRLFVSDELGRQELVLDVAGGRALAPIALGGEAGNSAYDPVSDRIWVAVQTRDEVVAIDPSSDSVLARIPVPGIAGPHGLLLDPAHRLAFVAGERNGRLGVLDLETLRMRGTYPVGDDPDVLAFDPGRRRLFVASESGVVAAFAVAGDSLFPLPRYRAPHAHTVAVDPSTHLVYLPLPSVGGQPVLRVLAAP